MAGPTVIHGAPVRRVAGIALAATLVVAPSAGVARGLDAAPDVAVKAAFLYNFAKFAEWPVMASGVPIALCIVGNDAIADALVQIVRGRSISGHVLDVLRPRDIATWGTCNLLFLAEDETQASAAALAGLRTSPVLTVSDGSDFAHTGGIIELYVEGGRMRFAINVDAADRARVHLSSRLLELARVIRNGYAQ